MSRVNETQMMRILIAASLIAAGCDRNLPTATPAGTGADVSAELGGDRPYTWSVKCEGTKYASSTASWSWTASGVAIEAAVGTTTCSPAASPINGSGSRPANADGFSACVNKTCQTWAFDATGTFHAQLKGSYTFYDASCAIYGGHTNGCKITVSATLTVDS